MVEAAIIAGASRRRDAVLTSDVGDLRRLSAGVANVEVIRL